MRQCHDELTLDELLADPLIGAVMRADGVDPRAARRATLRAFADRSARRRELSPFRDADRGRTVISRAPRSAARSRRAARACRCLRATRSRAISGKRGGALRQRRRGFGDALFQLGGLHLIGLGEHDLIAHRRVAERLEHARRRRPSGRGAHRSAHRRARDWSGPPDRRGSARSTPSRCSSAPPHSRSPACRRGAAPGAAAKKISSCVRPGVCEVRASALRPVSALIRLDLPTLERPANAISTPCIGGSRSIVPAAAVNCQSAANSLRPASISEEVKGMAPLTPPAARRHDAPGATR